MSAQGSDFVRVSIYDRNDPSTFLISRNFPQIPVDENHADDGIDAQRLLGLTVLSFQHDTRLEMVLAAHSDYLGYVHVDLHLESKETTGLRLRQRIQAICDRESENLRFATNLLSLITAPDQPGVSQKRTLWDILEEKTYEALMRTSRSLDLEGQHPTRRLIGHLLRDTWLRVANENLSKNPGAAYDAPEFDAWKKMMRDAWLKLTDAVNAAPTEDWIGPLARSVIEKEYAPAALENA